MVKKIFNSIFKDVLNKETFLKNRWHLHTLGILPFSIIFGYFSKYFNFQNNFEKIGEYFIPIFGIFLISFSVELFQQGKRIIGENERFESNKDGVFTTIIGSIFFIIFKLVFN